jgi:hypothetical protein
MSTLRARAVLIGDEVHVAGIKTSGDVVVEQHQVREKLVQQPDHQKNQFMVLLILNKMVILLL